MLLGKIKKNKKITMATKKQELKLEEKKQPSFFVRMFMDKNDINEKSIVGFGAFIMMVICLGVDIYTGLLGQEMPINEFVFDGFLYMALGSFGIASVDKFVSAKNAKKEESEEEAY
jgi:hypothetical protein